jgi:hypothetical protein
LALEDLILERRSESEVEVMQGKEHSTVAPSIGGVSMALFRGLFPSGAQMKLTDRISTIRFLGSFQILGLSGGADNSLTKKDLGQE